MELFFIKFWTMLVNLFNIINNTVRLTLFGFTAGFFDILIGFIIITMIISVFWRGVKG